MRRYLITFAAVTSLLNATPLIASDRNADDDAGVDPRDLNFWKQKAQAALTQGFLDPSAAQFQWDRAIVRGYWKPPLQRRIPGWWTCGFINGKNSFGAYTGFRRFVVVERNGEVVYLAVGSGENIDLVNAQCKSAIDKGVLPIADEASTLDTQRKALVQPIPDQPRLGLSFLGIPAGIKIAAIDSGSAAEAAGLKVGMVVTHLNGTSIAGMPDQDVAQLLRSDAGDIVFDVENVGKIKVIRPTKAIAV